MHDGRLSRVFLPPRAGEQMTDERARNVASMRMIYVGLALGLDVSLFLLLRRSPSLRPEIIQLFAIVNIGLMAIDLALTYLFLRRARRSYRAILVTCVLCETLAATVWIQMTGTVSSYFLIVGYLLILLYRLLFDYASGLTCALAMMTLHTSAFVLESVGAIRPASLFVAMPLGIYEVPLFRASAMLSLVVGYTITFLALNFFVSTLRDKEAALSSARRDLARAVDETHNMGRLCGQVLADQYELHELIGRGGMGEVYHGIRLGDRAPVAVKVLHVHLADRTEMRERFRREAQLVGRMPEAFVAKVLECGSTVDGQEYIVMEHLEGEDLATFLRRRGRMALGDVVPLVESIAAALDAAHAVGVVHRDLKPENIFLLHDGGVRLLDFGIARLQEGYAGDGGVDDGAGAGLTLTAELLGTPGYMAPEQARGDTKLIGPQTDVFALGAIVYRAITGKSPFPSRAPAAAVYEALHLVPPRPTSLVADLPTDVDHVLAIALAKGSADRYARPSLLARQLRLASESALGEADHASARLMIAAEESVTRQVQMTAREPAPKTSVRSK